MPAPELVYGFLMPGARARVESGHVDSLRFDAAVHRGVAAGTMRGAYHNLEVETLDPATGDRGLRKRIETFALNRVVLSSQNTRRDGGLRTGSIQHTHQEDDAFLQVPLALSAQRPLRPRRVMANQETGHGLAIERTAPDVLHMRLPSPFPCTGSEFMSRLQGSA